MDIQILDAAHPAWTREIDSLYALLGGAQTPTLFPYHFLQAVLPKIGGSVAVVRQGETPTVVGFLFPRLPATPFQRGDKAYTLRYHGLPDCSLPDLSLLLQECEQRLDGQVVPYDAQIPHSYIPDHQQCGGVDIGRPDQAEAIAIRHLQQQVWGSPPEFLYPADIHSNDFGLGSSLVARINGKPAGFLLGFIKYGARGAYTPGRHGDLPLPSDWSARFGGDLRIESQALGVLPAHRGARLGFLLKKVQAQQALDAGVQIINWTVDPLQWPNALLNFGLLRAVALDFAPDYYAFRNELNRVATSRFSLTWLVNTKRVRSHCRLETHDAVEIHPVILDLEQGGHIPRVNDGWAHLDDEADTEQIAIEIPANWTALQRDDVDAAVRWRTATDTLFQRYIGIQPRQYVITDVGVAGARRYLVAERAVEDCWERLGR
jgi:predicted GNAT superfamily acetyltransferase